MMKGWQPMKSAPKDGTRILVAEPYPSGTGYNIYEARYCTIYSSTRFTDDGPPEIDPHWWGLTWRTGMIGWEGVEGDGTARSKERSPYGREDLSVITPKFWMPLPLAPTEAGTAKTENTGLVHEGGK